MFGKLQAHGDDGIIGSSFAHYVYRYGCQHCINVVSICCSRSNAAMAGDRNMRRSAIYFALFGLAVAGTGYVLADELPPGMKVVQAPKPKATATPAPGTASQSREHMQGMDHGAQQMHDRMMHDYQMGMQNMQQSSGGGMAPDAAQSPTPMPMPSGKACCPPKSMKPADKPMPMSDM